MRDLLWRCDEHCGPDADFPALRGSRRRRSGDRGHAEFVEGFEASRLHGGQDHREVVCLWEREELPVEGVCAG